MRLVSHDISLLTGARTLVDALDLTLEAGEILGILGTNGAGKSTLLAVLAGLARPARGQVTLDGTPLVKLPPLARARCIGLLPQGDEGGFFGNVADFVALGHYPCGGPPDLAPHFAMWDLAALASRRFDTLSGGERQRARLAQLAVQRPEIMLLDEPLTYLDPAHRLRLLHWLREEADAGRSIVLTLHDPDWAAWYCDRLLFLYGDGRWCLGTGAELLTPDALEALYGPGTAILWQRAAARETV